MYVIFCLKRSAGNCPVGRFLLQEGFVSCAINIYLPLTAVTTPAGAACYKACNKAEQRISPRGTGTYEKGVMKKINVEMNVGFI